MAETIDDRYMINRALNCFGSAGIGALDEDTDLARQATGIYYPRIDTLLGLAAWPFSTKTYALDLLAETPINGYKYAFGLPGDALGDPWRILSNPRNPNDPFKQFTIEAGTLYADYKPLWAKVSVRSDPAVWWPVFREAAIKSAAARMCVPVSHDSKLAGELLIEAEGTSEENGRGGLVGQALAKLASSQPVTPLWRDPLSEARFS